MSRLRRLVFSSLPLKASVTLTDEIWSLFGNTLFGSNLRRNSKKSFGLFPGLSSNEHLQAHLKEVTEE